MRIYHSVNQTEKKNFTSPITLYFVTWKRQLKMKDFSLLKSSDSKVGLFTLAISKKGVDVAQAICFGKMVANTQVSLKII